MAEGGYHIIDEPAPSALSRFIVNPFLIVLFAMVAPAILAGVLARPQLLFLLWFGLNGFALGSPTRMREMAWIAGGLLLLFGFVELLGWIVAAGLVAEPTMTAALPYLRILHSAALLTIFYRLFLYQHGPYQLHRYLQSARAA